MKSFSLVIGDPNFDLVKMVTPLHLSTKVLPIFSFLIDVWVFP